MDVHLRTAYRAGLLLNTPQHRLHVQLGAKPCVVDAFRVIGVDVNSVSLQWLKQLDSQGLRGAVSSWLPRG